MAEEDIGGLSAEISGDASRLWSVLQQSEVRMRQFVAQYGNITLQVRANVQIPSATAILDARRSISRQFRDPATGGIVAPIQMAMPSRTALTTFTRSLTGQIGTLVVNVRGNWIGWQTAPPTGTIGVTGGAGAGPIARPEARPTAIAAGPKTVTRQGGPGQRTYFSDGTSRWEPAGGPQGSRGGYAVGGENLPGGPAGIGGFNPFGFMRGRNDLYENSLAQEDFIRAQRTGALRTAGGQFTPAGAAAMAAQRQRVPVGQPEGGRFVSAATAATQMPLIISTGQTPLSSAVQVQRPSLTPQRGTFNAAGFSEKIAAESNRRAEMMALSSILSIPVGELENYQPGMLTASINSVKASQAELFEQKKSEALDQLQTGVRTGGAAATGMGRQVVLPESRQRIIGQSAQLQAAQATLEQSQLQGFASRAAQPTSLRIAFARGIGSLFGTRDVQELEKQRAQAESRLTQFSAAAIAATDRREKFEGKLQDREVKGLPITQLQISALEKLKNVENDSNKAVEEQTKVLDAATAAAGRAGGAAKGFASSFLGGVVGGLAFGTAMQGVMGAFSLLAQGMQKPIESLTQFRGVAQEVGDTIGAIVQQMNGRTQAAVAQAFAQAATPAALSALIQPGIVQQANISANLSAFQAQTALSQTAASRLLAPQVGITESVGNGPLGIGNQKGMLEQIGDLLNQIPQTMPKLPSLGLLNPPSGITPETVKAITAMFQTQVNSFLKGTGITAQTSADQKTIQAQSDAIRALGTPGANKLADTIADKMQLFVDKNGKPLTADALVKAVTQVITGQGPRPEIKDLIAQQQDQINAQKALFREQSQTQRNRFLPAEFALQQLSTPLTAFGAGVTQRAPTTVGGRPIPISGAFGGAFGGAGFEATAKQFGGAFDALAPTIAGVDKQLVDLQQKGQAALEAIVPKDQITQFKALETQISNVGTTISGLQLGVQQEQVNLQVAQYNEQLRIAYRSETDLLQLTKSEGMTRGDNLGFLERQVIDEQRVSQQLSIQSEELANQLQQRQINFQIALAGFAAPGATPAERAARIEEAKLEAEYAQKQLDIKKQQTAISAQVLQISFKIQDIGFIRQLVDVQKQIGLLNQGIKVSVDTAAAQQAIAHLSALEDYLVKQASTYVQEGTQIITSYQTAAAQIKATTAQGFSTILQQTAKAWGVFLTQGEVAINAMVGSGGVPHQVAPAYQQGFLGSVNRATTMTVGEAGNETVAVLRNPRQMAMGGGGTQINVSVVVTGNTVRSDDDLKQLVRQITSEVERSISRKISLLGGRGAAVS